MVGTASHGHLLLAGTREPECDGCIWLQLNQCCVGPCGTRRRCSTARGCCRRGLNAQTQRIAAHLSESTVRVQRTLRRLLVQALRFPLNSLSCSKQAGHPAGDVPCVYIARKWTCVRKERSDCYAQDRCPNNHKNLFVTTRLRPNCLSRPDKWWPCPAPEMLEVLFQSLSTTCRPSKQSCVFAIALHCTKQTCQQIP